jgi:hypothetical protein
MRKLLIILLLLQTLNATTQELFVSTEPASNMATGSIGLRFTSRLFQMNHDGIFEEYRIAPELMVGVNKKFMIHIAGYGSNMFQRNFRIEGGSIYGKYRFFSVDDVHTHFRMAVYGKVAIVKNPEVLESIHKHEIPDGNGGYVIHDLLVFSQSDDIDLEGNTSGMNAGIIATKLINKFAASGSLGYGERFNNIGFKSPAYQPKNEITYSVSAGYLLFPRQNTSYRQLNCNVYLELLGSSFMDKKLYYTDLAPAVQFIINSIARIDVSYRSQLAGTVPRVCNNSFLLRLEYNLLNVLPFLR